MWGGQEIIGRAQARELKVPAKARVVRLSDPVAGILQLVFIV